MKFHFWAQTCKNQWFFLPATLTWTLRLLFHHLYVNFTYFKIMRSNQFSCVADWMKTLNITFNIESLFCHKVETVNLFNSLSMLVLEARPAQEGSTARRGCWIPTYVRNYEFWRWGVCWKTPIHYGRSCETHQRGRPRSSSYVTHKFQILISRAIAALYGYRDSVVLWIVKK